MLKMSPLPHGQTKTEVLISRMSPVRAAKLVLPIVIPTKKEEHIEYKPLPSTVVDTVRAIEIIGPRGIVTEWITEKITPYPKKNSIQIR
jgi:hypothetical protein